MYSLDELVEFVLTASSSYSKAWRIEEYIEARESLTQKERKVLRGLCRILLTDPDSCERVEAVELLGGIGNRNDIFAIKMACRDPEWVVRCPAASTLASVAGAGAFRYLTKMADDPNPHVRRWVYTAIWDCGHPDREAWLRARESVEKNEKALFGIWGALRELGDEAVKERLEMLAESEDMRTRSRAIGALGLRED
ncbi:MAG: HEAT repeat domain-containing protein [Armatimonadetes bacterium]|nr:HEAT repeat domain-containing protein [Armatimonadota bacterium]